MYRMHNKPKNSNGPHTAGATIHWAPQYDLFTRLAGLGVNRPNSTMVVELAKIKAGDTVLDVGCGTGNLTMTAKSAVGKSGKVYGIDAAPEMIELAQKKARQEGIEVTFEIGLVEKIPFPNASFDVVINRLMIHHLPDDLKHQAFAEILRVLKPGGSLLVADFRPPTNPLVNHIASALVGPEMMRINIASILPMLKTAGFQNITSGPTRSAFLAFVSAEKPAA